MLREIKLPLRAPGALNLPGLAWGLEQSHGFRGPAAVHSLLPAGSLGFWQPYHESGAVTPGRRYAPLRRCLLRARWCRLQHTATEHDYLSTWHESVQQLCKRVQVLFPVYRCGKWSTKRLVHLPTVTEMVSSRAGI